MSEEGHTGFPQALPVVYGFAGVCTLLAVGFSVHLLYHHLRNFSRPNHQRCIVRIIFMVPLYAIFSFVSLFVYDYQPYLAIFRDSYEAYALYMFFALCIAYVGSTDHLTSVFLMQPRTKCVIPLWCEFQPNKRMMLLCRQGILQYALLRPLVSLTSAILMGFGYYVEGEWRTDNFYPYATIINNICVTICLYFLALFYKLAADELKPYKPVLKFASIKMIVFFCYWQSVAISIAVALGLIPRVENWSEGQVAVSIQNVLICFEMFIFSLFHLWAFPYDLYKVKAWSQAPLIHQVELGGGVIKGVAQSVNQADMINDTVESFIPDILKKKQLQQQTQQLQDVKKSADSAKQAKKLEKKRILDYPVNNDEDDSTDTLPVVTDEKKDRSSQNHERTSIDIPLHDLNLPHHSNNNHDDEDEFSVPDDSATVRKDARR